MDTSRRPKAPQAVPHDGHDRAGPASGPHAAEHVPAGLGPRRLHTLAQGHGGGDPHHQADGQGGLLQPLHRPGDRTRTTLHSPLAKSARPAEAPRWIGGQLPDLQGGGEGEDRRATQEGRLAVAGLLEDRDSSPLRSPVGLAGGSEAEGRADPQCPLGTRPDDQAANRRGRRYALEGHAEELAQQRSGGELSGPSHSPRPGRGDAAGKRGPRAGKGPLNQHLRFAGLVESRPAGGHGG